jgi:hypothetical protein
MRKPWANKTSLAKTAAILATMALVSLGLCGVNFFTFQSFYGGSWGLGHLLSNVIFQILFWGAWVEAAAIAVSVTGLIVVGVMAVWRGLRGGSNGHRGKEN